MVVGHVPIVVGDNVRVRRRGITKQEMLVINVYDVGKKSPFIPIGAVMLKELRISPSGVVL